MRLGSEQRCPESRCLGTTCEEFVQLPDGEKVVEACAGCILRVWLLCHEATVQQQMLPDLDNTPLVALGDVGSRCSVGCGCQTLLGRSCSIRSMRSMCSLGTWWLR